VIPEPTSVKRGGKRRVPVLLLTLYYRVPVLIRFAELSALVSTSLTEGVNKATALQTSDGRLSRKTPTPRGECASTSARLLQFLGCGGATVYTGQQESFGTPTSLRGEANYPFQFNRRTSLP
jgi:hypothetical protein